MNIYVYGLCCISGTQYRLYKQYSVRLFKVDPLALLALKKTACGRFTNILYPKNLSFQVSRDSSRNIVSQSSQLVSWNHVFI